MYNFEIVLALLVGVALLALLARRLTVPTPAILVAGGLLVALLPGLPAVRFDPQLVFLVFIPPLLYRASLLASYRDVRANLRPILSLGVGHVLFATLAVAWVAHRTVPGLPWASAFVLGAVVSPPDVAAATAFLRRLPMPRRVVTVLEGESMVNDAAAIVAYRMAIAAAVSGAFSLGEASMRLLAVGAGGRPARESRGDRRAVGLDLPGGEFSLAVWPAAAAPRAAAAVADPHGGRLGRPAGRRFVDPGRRRSHHDGGGGPVPRPRRHY